MNSVNSANPLLISVVVPIYREERNVRPLTERLAHVFARLGCSWELIFALDPSPDRTHDEILRLFDEQYPIRVITFSRRIGKPLSLIAGLDHVQGNACVIIDADLQDPPELIEEMVRKWEEGFEVVIAGRVSRKGENFLYLKAAQTFYWLLDKMSDVQVPKNTGDFRLLDVRVVEQIRRFRERHGFLRGMTAAAGFRTTVIPYDRDPRLSGRTQISFRGALNIALDGIVPFSRVPVRAVFVVGVSLLAIGLVSACVWLIAGLLNGFSKNEPITFLCILITFLSGIVVSSLGILGEYLVRTYEETRERPLYIVDRIEESPSLHRKLPDPIEPTA
ncbi:MAG TPA: glycosyltransferase family 2 protein [Desulfomonilaceae bacterium]|nr:glycosyltransferase family 2 protein [Desulfomonilaceae bacterium]